MKQSTTTKTKLNPVFVCLTVCLFVWLCQSRPVSFQQLTHRQTKQNVNTQRVNIDTALQQQQQHVHRVQSWYFYG